MAEHDAELIRLIGAHALDRHNTHIAELISDFQISSNLPIETADSTQNGGMAWRYLLIPHTAVAVNKTLDGLIGQFSV